MMISGPTMVSTFGYRLAHTPTLKGTACVGWAQQLSYGIAAWRHANVAEEGRGRGRGALSA